MEPFALPFLINKHKNSYQKERAADFPNSLPGSIHGPGKQYFNIIKGKRGKPGKLFLNFKGNFDAFAIVIETGKIILSKGSRTRRPGGLLYKPHLPL